MIGVGNITLISGKYIKYLKLILMDDQEVGTNQLLPMTDGNEGIC